MNNDIDQSVKKYDDQLNQLGIGHEIIRHPDLRTPPEVLSFLGLDLSDGSSTLIMKADAKFIAVIRRDDCKLDLNRLRKALDIKDIRMAKPEEFKDITNLPLGAARIYNPNLKTYIDEKVLEKEYVTGGSGTFTETVRYKTSDLVKIPESEIVNVTNVVNLDQGSTNKSLEVKRILSGITPSGNALHIGNYFGAVGPQIELQNRDLEVYYFVADLHALTTVQDKNKLEDNITNVVLDYLALGLNPEKCVFFRQSQVPQHSQLAVILANFISYGQMQRMHAFKDKLQIGVKEESVNMGLFNYPILMAADILLYKPFGVPVGEDQRQHIELTRDIADKFNRVYKKKLFPLPDPLISKDTGRVIGTDGQRKMSKSLGNIIGIFDDYEVIKKQIMSAYTDPNRKKVTDPGRVEGNTVFAYHDLLTKDKELVTNLKTRYIAGDIGDVEIKERLLESHKVFFKEAREKRKHFENNLHLVKNILEEGSKKAKIIAQSTLDEVYGVIGINNKLN